MHPHFAKRMSVLKTSEIREILKITENSDIISFAGGLPAPELFPVRELKECSNLVLERHGMQALQYATTEGYAPLRAWVAARMNATLGTRLDAESVLITQGSQQALDLTGKVFLDEGDTVLCESPTYLAAISAFRAYGCAFAEVPTDADGMHTDALDAVIAASHKPKLIYVIPNFQNPGGITLHLNRRKALAETAARHQVQVIEDNPYGELRFEGAFLPAVQAFDPHGNVLGTGSFSKILSPGLRIGWIAGDREIIKKYALVKQGADLQCNTFAQMVIATFLERYDIDRHIATVVAVYKRRRDLALEAMRRVFPAGVQYTVPQGGLFIWVTVPEGLSAVDLLHECLRRKVAFVPGGSFFPGGGHENTLRLNFSNANEACLVEGIEIMAEAMQAVMHRVA